MFFHEYLLRLVNIQSAIHWDCFRNRSFLKAISPVQAVTFHWNHKLWSKFGLITKINLTLRFECRADENRFTNRKKKKVFRVNGNRWKNWFHSLSSKPLVHCNGSKNLLLHFFETTCMIRKPRHEDLCTNRDMNKICKSFGRDGERIRAMKIIENCIMVLELSLIHISEPTRPY